MTNILAMRRPLAAHSGGLPAVPALAQMFATGRRGRHDAFWLKENAEFLQVLLATGTRADLAPYAAFVPGLMADLRFFPQYYRLFLSLALDLRALGMQGVPVEAMADHVIREGLAELEVSDMARAEAALLLARAGHRVQDGGVHARLARFSADPARFALPNQRAAYDLTHLVFHAADYGRRPLATDAARGRSLIHAGIIAFLDDNMDLLAEITIALRLSGEPVPALWDRAVGTALAGFEIRAGGSDAAPQDAYHAYLVQNWAVAMAGGQAFAGQIAQGANVIDTAGAQTGTLRAVQMALLEMGDARRRDWTQMRWRIGAALAPAQRARIEQTEDMPEFTGFFAAFARAQSGEA